MVKEYSGLRFLSHPLALICYAFGNRRMLHEAVLMKAGAYLLGDAFNRVEAKQYLKEIREGDFIPMRQLPGVKLPGNRPGHLFGKFLYFITRCMKPEVMIETGVAHGSSSWTILNAIHRNGKGRLYSIDLPDKDLSSYNPGTIEQTSGWAVPDELRGYWDLRLGSSADLLPALLAELRQADVFFHDSDHSYRNMMFEFEAAYPFISKGGLIISDDVHKNHSFRDFVNNHAIRAVMFAAKGGAGKV